MCARIISTIGRENCAISTFSMSTWWLCFLFRGRFSIVLNVQPREGVKIKRVAKVSEFDPVNSERSLREYEVLKAVRQEHVIRLYEAFLWNNFVVLVFEKLYGENVVRSLSLKNRYTEYTVTTIVKQVRLNFLMHSIPAACISTSFRNFLKALIPDNYGIRKCINFRYFYSASFKGSRTFPPGHFPPGLFPPEKNENNFS